MYFEMKNILKATATTLPNTLNYKNFTFIKYRVNYRLVFIVYIYKNKIVSNFCIFNHFNLVDEDYKFFGWIMALFASS
jgi:hypothetical protein